MVHHSKRCTGISPPECNLRQQLEVRVTAPGLDDPFKLAIGEHCLSDYRYNILDRNKGDASSTDARCLLNEPLKASNDFVQALHFKLNVFETLWSVSKLANQADDL